jgi:polar amino acid transport system permease protein
MDWLTTITHTFFDIPSMLQVFPQLLGVGLVNTLVISIAATVIGVVLGMAVAVMGISTSRWLRIPARIYTDVFRGLPAILTILLIGQGFARFSQSIFGPSPYPLGILALSLIAAAYIGEIFRSGIQSVDKGQLEASRALGFGYGASMRLVVVPQGIRRVLPALVNQFIALIKETSVVSFVGAADLYVAFNYIGSNSYEFMVPYLVMAIIYIALVMLITLGIKLMERRLAKSDRRN